MEFAIILAFFLLPLFLGLIEIITIYRAEAKLNMLAINVAQMAAIESQATTTGTGGNDGVSTVALSGAGSNSLQDICQGAVLGLAPFPANGMTLAIASITQEAGPNGQPTNSSAHAASASYDEWEGDFTVSGTHCTPVSGGTGQIGLSTAETMATTPPARSPGTTGLVVVPCDNAIIVRAQIAYPGIVGLILQNRPLLSQTVYTRWRYASTTTELQCGNCTVINNAASQICNTNNNATN